MKNCCIVIPCHKVSLTKYEASSLMRCITVLSNFDIFLITYNDLNLKNYSYIFNKTNKTYFVKYFDKKYFASITSYNSLMLDKNFYRIFDNYEFMLIYQLDAWVFRDELEFWLHKGFDYIGAPWFIDYDSSNQPMPFMEYCGNGGFSLRNIEKMYKLLSMNIYLPKTFMALFKANKKKKLVSNILSIPIFYLKWLFQKERFLTIWQLATLNEDTLIAKVARKYYPDFKIATAQEAMPFAFECKPDYLFKLNGNKLPFGCHAYRKYNWNFWKKYINISII